MRLRTPALRLVRTATGSTLAAATLVGGTQLVVGSLAVAASTSMTATATVNVRSGPGMDQKIIGLLQQGARVPATGPSRNGWTPVNWNGRRAWINSAYLTTSVRSAPIARTTTVSRGVTTEDVNVRTGPSLSNTVVTVMAKGSSVQLTGTSSGNWLQVSIGGRTLWMSKSYVSTNTAGPVASVNPSGSLPRVTSKARAEVDLMIRTNPGPNFDNLGDIPADTILNLTGVTSQGVSQIVLDGAVRWVNSQYLAPVDSSTGVQAPATPKVVGYRYATTALNIRTTPTGDGTLFEVPTGTKLAITGVNSNGRAQVVYQGAVRWVTAAYIAPSLVSGSPSTATTLVSNRSGGSLNTGDSSGLDGLQPNGKLVVYAVRANFPQITTMYGVRPDPLPDHPTGHAVDIMLPNYTVNEAMGWTIAHYMQAHASELGINYIIFHQHIWSVARSSEGWRLMADRGDDTANHFNHVHVTVN